MNPVGHKKVSYASPTEEKREEPLALVDVEKMEVFLDKSEILTPETCREMDVEILNELALSKSKEFKDLFERCQFFAKQQQCLEYSKDLSRAEQAVTSIENIINALISKADSLEKWEPPIDLENHKGALKKLQQNIPVGESLFLQSDIEKLKQISTVSQNTTYVSEKFGKFYEPQVSMTAMMGWFEKCNKNSAYSGVAVGFKVDSIYSTPLESMVTIIAFTKGTPPKQIKEKSPGLMPALFTKLSNALFPASKSSTQKSGVVERKKADLTLQRINDRKASLALVKQDLPKMLEGWNFEAHFETCSKNDLIEKYHAPIERADEADVIILYHKKAD